MVRRFGIFNAKRVLLAPKALLHKVSLFFEEKVKLLLYHLDFRSKTMFN